MKYTCHVPSHVSLILGNANSASRIKCLRNLKRPFNALNKPKERSQSHDSQHKPLIPIPLIIPKLSHRSLWRSLKPIVENFQSVLPIAVTLDVSLNLAGVKGAVVEGHVLWYFLVLDSKLFVVPVTRSLVRLAGGEGKGAECFFDSEKS